VVKTADNFEGKCGVWLENSFGTLCSDGKLQCIPAQKAAAQKSITKDSWSFSVTGVEV